MSARAFLVSLLIVFHLIAITLAAIPAPTTDAPLEPTPRLDTDPVAITLTPVIDRIATAVAQAETLLLRWTRPVSALTKRYVDIGLPQRWNMFSDPVTASRYLRFDWYVADPSHSKAARLFRELVLPSLPESQTRWWYSARDKAVSVSLRSYQSPDEQEMSSPRSGDPRLPRHSRIAPLVKYFQGRFVAAHGIVFGQIVRTEIWGGAAPIPAPSDIARPTGYHQRRQILAKYRDPQPTQVTLTAHPEVWSTYREADIVWQLIYVENR